MINKLRNVLAFIGLLFIVLSTIALYQNTQIKINLAKNMAIKILGLSADYSGFVANSVDDYLTIFKSYFQSFYKAEKLPNINLILSFKNLSILDSQRTGDIEHGFKALGTIEVDNKEKMRIKIRAKGDRMLHRDNFETMSYKVDLKGKNRVFGLEEFAIQRPIVRNYGWELLIVKIAKKLDVLAPTIIPINLSVNGTKNGIYIIEENISKEFLEFRNRKGGPVYGLHEQYSSKYPNVVYETNVKASSGFATKEFLTQVGFEKLSQIKNSFDSENFNVSHYFDIEAWSKYFALIDMFGSYHGAVPKSVKLYFNPTTQLFEPIMYDNHLGGSNYTNFSLIDFHTKSTFDYETCGFACSHSEWFKLFFKNTEFVKLFVKSLRNLITMYKEGEFSQQIYEVEQFNSLLYARFAPSDRVFFEGILPYFMDITHIDRRINLIEAKLLETSFLTKSTLEQFSESFIHDNICSKDSEHHFCIKNFSNIRVLKNIDIQGKDLLIENDTVTFFIGNTVIKNSNILGKNSGMIVQMGGNIVMENVIIDGIKNILIPNTNWTGAFNLIKSKAELTNVVIKNTLGEDAFNVVHSTLNIKEGLNFENIESDAFDADFTNVFFDRIECINTGNDCFDTSGSRIEGKVVIGYNVKDKLGSFGEASKGVIKNLTCNDCGIGVAVKDSSDIKISDIVFQDTPLHISVFQKKPFFNSASLSLNQMKSSVKDEQILLGKGSEIKFLDAVALGKMLDINVKEKQYGNDYGRSSIK